MAWSTVAQWDSPTGTPWEDTIASNDITKNSGAANPSVAGGIYTAPQNCCIQTAAFSSVGNTFAIGFNAKLYASPTPNSTTYFFYNFAFNCYVSVVASSTVQLFSGGSSANATGAMDLGVERRWIFSFNAGTIRLIRDGSLVLSQSGGSNALGTQVTFNGFNTGATNSGTWDFKRIRIVSGVAEGSDETDFDAWLQGSAAPTFVPPGPLGLLANRTHSRM